MAYRWTVLLRRGLKAAENKPKPYRPRQERPLPVSRGRLTQASNGGLESGRDSAALHAYIDDAAGSVAGAFFTDSA